MVDYTVCSQWASKGRQTARGLCGQQLETCQHFLTEHTERLKISKINKGSLIIRRRAYLGGQSNYKRTTYNLTIL